MRGMVKLLKRMASLWGTMIAVEDLTRQRLQTHIGRVCVLTKQAENVGSITELRVDDFTYKIRVFKDATVAAVAGQRYTTTATFSESDSNSGSLSVEEGEWNPGFNSNDSEFIADSADSANKDSEWVGLAKSVKGSLGSGSTNRQKGVTETTRLT